MRILLDENLDWRLSRHLSEHEVNAITKIGWAGIKSGELLRRAAVEFDVLKTLDGSIPHQQDLSKHNLAIISLRARSNRLADTAPLMPIVLTALATVQPGQNMAVPSDLVEPADTDSAG